MRSQEEIDRQIQGIEHMKTVLPEFSMFGTPNHQMWDAQIEILHGNDDVDDYPEGDWEAMDEENEIYRAAETASEWLDGTSDEDLFEE